MKLTFLTKVLTFCSASFNKLEKAGPNKALLFYTICLTSNKPIKALAIKVFMKLKRWPLTWV
jgi:hypothetical protein